MTNIRCGPISLFKPTCLAAKEVVWVLNGLWNPLESPSQWKPRMRLPPCTEYLLPMLLLCPWRYFTLAYSQTIWPPDGSNQQGGGGQPLLPVNADESVLEQTEPSDPAGMEILHIVIFLLLFFTSHWIRLYVLFCYILCALQFILELSVQIYRAFFNDFPALFCTCFLFTA